MSLLLTEEKCGDVIEVLATAYGIVGFDVS
jgi:hypothetical protein